MASLDHVWHWQCPISDRGLRIQTSAHACARRSAARRSEHKRADESHSGADGEDRRTLIGRFDVPELPCLWGEGREICFSAERPIGRAACGLQSVAHELSWCKDRDGSQTDRLDRAVMWSWPTSDCDRVLNVWRARTRYRYPRVRKRERKIERERERERESRIDISRSIDTFRAISSSRRENTHSRDSTIQSAVRRARGCTWIIEELTQS